MEGGRMTSKDFQIPRHAVSTKHAAGMIVVEWSDGTMNIYDAFKLGRSWFKMSNDAFFQAYGFNFNPHNIPGLYERCRKAVYPNE